MFGATLTDKSSEDVTRAGSIWFNSIKFQLKCRLAFFIILAMTCRIFAAGGYDLIFSTYFGGSDWEHARDVVVDNSGNIYVVGGTASADFPTTFGAYSRLLQTGGTQEFGPCDIFVANSRNINI